MRIHPCPVLVPFLFAGWLLIPGQGLGSPISVANFSFEAPALSEGSFNVGLVTSWTVAGVGGGGGVFYPIVGTHFSTEVPDGSQTLYLNQGTASQVLSSVLTANTHYTLEVDVGRRLPPTGFPGYTVELLAGSTIIGSESSLVPVAGTFMTSTIGYTASNSDPLLGQPLQIRFTSVFTQTNFDNVRLDASAVPEPTCLTLIVVGLFAAGGMRYWHRRPGLPS